MLLAALTLVVCAPGYPGSSGEAQPAMDALARALSQAAGEEVRAVYEETAEGGLRRLAAPEAALLLATLPFYLDHEPDLALRPRRLARPKDGEPLQRWTLVAGRGVGAPREIVSKAGGSPRFVHAMAQGFATARVTTSQQVLSALRRAANEQGPAVLLDGAEARALPTLPFAARLSTLSTSPAVPVAVLAAVGKRLDPRRLAKLEAALAKLPADALDAVQMAGFVPLDAAALDAARAAYAR